jgi:hypothetical protein
MAYTPKTKKIKLLVDRNFGTTEGKAGKTYDVEPFWADNLIAEGSAEDAAAAKEAAEAEAEKPAARGKAK